MIVLHYELHHPFYCGLYFVILTYPEVKYQTAQARPSRL